MICWVVVLIVCWFVGGFADDCFVDCCCVICFDCLMIVRWCFDDLLGGFVFTCLVYSLWMFRWYFVNLYSCFVDVRWLFVDVLLTWCRCSVDLLLMFCCLFIDFSFIVVDSVCQQSFDNIEPVSNLRCGNPIATTFRRNHAAQTHDFSRKGFQDFPPNLSGWWHLPLAQPFPEYFKYKFLGCAFKHVCC